MCVATYFLIEIDVRTTVRIGESLAGAMVLDWPVLNRIVRHLGPYPPHQSSYSPSKKPLTVRNKKYGLTSKKLV